MNDQRTVPTHINFDYLKSPHFRTVHVDGAIGGPTPSGLIHAALFSERTAIPQRLVHTLKPDGTLGDVVDDMTVTRGGVVRELEVDLILTPDVAESIANWLLQRASEARSRTQTTPT